MTLETVAYLFPAAVLLGNHLVQLFEVLDLELHLFDCELCLLEHQLFDSFSLLLHHDLCVLLDLFQRIAARLLERLRDGTGAACLGVLDLLLRVAGEIRDRRRVHAVGHENDPLQRRVVVLHEFNPAAGPQNRVGGVAAALLFTHPRKPQGALLLGLVRQHFDDRIPVNRAALLPLHLLEKRVLIRGRPAGLVGHLLAVKFAARLRSGLLFVAVVDEVMQLAVPPGLVLGTGVHLQNAQRNPP